MLQKLSTGYKFSSAGAMAMLFCFFLPWVLVSCGGQPVVTLTGSDLLTGVEVGNGMDPLEGNPLYALVPLVSVLTLVLAGLSLQHDSLNAVDRLGLTVIGAAAVAFMLYSWVNFAGAEGRLAEQGMGGAIQVQMQSGFWGSLVGALLVLAGGVNNLQTRPLPQPATISEPTA